jgi:hypothetical protein
MKRGWRCPFIARKGKGEGRGGGGVGARRPAINGGGGWLGAAVTGEEGAGTAVGECGGFIYCAVEEADGRGAAGNGAGVRRPTAARGRRGAAGGGRRPRQVGPTCRWLCERERGRRAEREVGRLGRNRALGRRVGLAGRLV